MTNTVPSKHRLAIPDEAFSDRAAQAADTLEQLLARHPDATAASVSMLLGEDEASVDVPIDVLKLLVRMLAETASGNAVAVSPVNAELTTQQAADLLNVSRPYLVKLLDERRIPFRRVGNRRRILLVDIMTFKHDDESERRAIAAELSAKSEQSN